MKAERDGLAIIISDYFRKWTYSCRITYRPELDAFEFKDGGIVAATNYSLLCRVIYENLGYEEKHRWYQLKHRRWAKIDSIWFLNSEQGWVRTWQRCDPFDVVTWLRKGDMKFIGVVLSRPYREIRKEHEGSTAMLANRRLFSIFGKVLPNNVGPFEDVIRLAPMTWKVSDEVLVKDYMADRKLAALVAGYEGSRDEFNRLREYAWKHRSWRRSTLPAGVPVYVFFACLYKASVLKRPLRTLMDWLWLTSVPEQMFGSIIDDDWSNAFNRSSDEQMWKAYRIVAGRLHLPEKTRKAKPILAAIRYTMDLPDDLVPKRGSLVAVAEASAEWHKQRLLLREEQRKLKFQHPPIGLPEDPEIKFLSCGEELEREGAEMNHCVASYVYSASKGDCYLFSYAGKHGRATIEVSPHGKVVQSYEQSNQTGPASKHAARVLGRWAKNLAKGAIT